MPNIREINEILNQTQSLELVTQAYEEIAAIKLKKIRSAVLQNISFYNEITNVYAVVKNMAIKRNLSSKAKNKKTISVLITSNYHFYGRINHNLIHHFLVNTNRYPTDRMVIGKTAVEHLRGVRYANTYNPMVMKHDLPSREELDAINEKVKDYSKILVYYAQFKSVLRQDTTIKDITLSEFPVTSKTAEQINSEFILEPEINRMLSFFESQITILLLEAIFLESELSRTAARLVSMNEAYHNAQDQIREQKKLFNVAKMSIYNNKLLETISALINTNYRYG